MPVVGFSSFFQMEGLAKCLNHHFGLTNPYRPSFVTGRCVDLVLVGCSRTAHWTIDYIVQNSAIEVGMDVLKPGPTILGEYK